MNRYGPFGCLWTEKQAIGLSHLPLHLRFFTFSSLQSFLPHELQQQQLLYYLQLQRMVMNLLQPDYSNVHVILSSLSLHVTIRGGIYLTANHHNAIATLTWRLNNNDSITIFHQVQKGIHLAMCWALSILSPVQEPHRKFGGKNCMVEQIPSVAWRTKGGHHPKHAKPHRVPIKGKLIIFF